MSAWSVRTPVANQLQAKLESSVLQQRNWRPRAGHDWSRSRSMPVLLRISHSQAFHRNSEDALAQDGAPGKRKALWIKMASNVREEQPFAAYLSEDGLGICETASPNTHVQGLEASAIARLPSA